MTTVEELRERVEVFGPFTETVELRDEDDEPTGETVDVTMMTAEVCHDETVYARRIAFDPSFLYDEVVDKMRRELIDSVVQYALDPDSTTPDATNGVNLAAQVRLA